MNEPGETNTEVPLKNYRSIKVIISTLICISAFSAYGGPSTGGGGGAFVCRDQSGNIQRSVLLDVWEASNVYGWAVSRNNSATSAQQIQMALKKFEQIDPSFSKVVASRIFDIQSRATYVPGTVSFNPPEDAKAQYSDPTCTLSGMLYFDDQLQKLFVSQPVFEKLETETDFAGAWLHETIYKISRESLGARDSLSTRIVVGCVLSADKSCLVNSDLKSIFKEYSKVELCQSPSVDYYKGSKLNQPQSPSLLAIKRINNYDFSSNYLLSVSANSLSLSASLADLKLNPWNITFIETTGSYWPLPLGLTVSNRLTNEVADDSGVQCSEIKL